MALAASGALFFDRFRSRRTFAERRRVERFLYLMETARGF
jgi:hypothetical protein